MCGLGVPRCNQRVFVATGAGMISRAAGRRTN
jgi:hypothetical protein